MTFVNFRIDIFDAKKFVTEFLVNLLQSGPTSDDLESLLRSFDIFEFLLSTHTFPPASGFWRMKWKGKKEIILEERE